MPAARKTKKNQTSTIEELIQRLEELTGQIEDPDTGLENSIELYEEGRSVAEECGRRLQETRKKLETINPDKPAQAVTPAQPAKPEPPKAAGLFDLES